MSNSKQYPDSFRRLAYRLLDRGHSHAEVARQLGVHVSTVKCWENIRIFGESRPSLKRKLVVLRERLQNSNGVWQLTKDEPLSEPED